MFFFKKSSLLLIVIATVLLGGCDDGTTDAGNKNGIDIVRYDRLVFGIDKNDVKAGFDSLEAGYPEITDIFFKNILDMPGYKSEDSVFFAELKTFITDSSMMDLYNLCQDEFGDMDDIRIEFKQAFDKAKKLYPEIKIPRVYSFISGFAMQRFLFDDKRGAAIAFGLDMFLGKRFGYERLERGQGTFSDYFSRTYNKDHLVKKVLELWLDDVIGDTNKERALDKMIKNGKKLYLIKQIMPEIEDTILLNYSGSQLKWLENNEQELWSFMIKNNLFYTTNDYEIKRLIDPAPNSQALGMPFKSPGQTGVYMGYRIVNAYMRRNHEMSIEDLIKDRNTEKILSKSKFKPKRKN